MQAMGDKNAARACARKAGVPVTPGSDGIVETEDEAIRIAKKIGYPVMIKATAGGGGRGMRIAHNEPSLKSAFHSARHEAQKAFGSEQVYLEKLIHNPHHIEFQIVADSHGRIVHLGERGCTPSNAGSMPKTQPTIFRLRRVGSIFIMRRADAEFESTRTFIQATPCRRTMTR